MIRSRAVRSILAVEPSSILFRCGSLGRLDPELRHQGRDLGCGQCGTCRLGAANSLGPGCCSLLKEGAKQFDRDRKDGGGVVLRGDLGDRLKVAELKRAWLDRQLAGGL